MKRDDIVPRLRSEVILFYLFVYCIVFRKFAGD